MTPPGDLREWVALLEREGELVRISAEVDPDLEITEINDRVVKAGGPGAPVRERQGLVAPAADQPVRDRAPDVHGVRRADARRRRAAARRRARDAAAAGPRGEGEGAAEAEVDRRLAAEDRAQRPVAGGRPHGRRRRSRPAADPALLAGRPRAVHHAARGDHARPARPARATSACTGCRRSTGARR